jgi:hypothetical protein
MLELHQRGIESEDSPGGNSRSRDTFEGSCFCDGDPWRVLCVATASIVGGSMEGDVVLMSLVLEMLRL